MTKIESKLSADTRYDKGGRAVLVRGLAVRWDEEALSVAHRTSIVTEISDDDAKFLCEHNLFKQHQTDGFVKIVNGSAPRRAG